MYPISSFVPLVLIENIGRHIPAEIDEELVVNPKIMLLIGGDGAQEPAPSHVCRSTEK
jgi:hypothetical protein